MLLAGCSEAGRLVELAPQLIALVGGAPAFAPRTGRPATRSAELPPEQSSEAFDFEPAGSDQQGRRLYHIRIRPGGSPYAVAVSRFTPLFSVDGKSAATYVGEAYFRAHPERTPFSVQPGDEFLLALPPDTFLVRWQEERQEDFGHPARLREYVSEQGDRLRFYLTDPFPIRYALVRADTPGREEIHLSVDLAYLLGVGRTDPIRLARLIYRVPDPDIFQVEAMRRLAADLRPGVEKVIEVDRTQSYLDPARQALTLAERTEPVTEPERGYLTRAVFPLTANVPYLAIEDGLGTHTDLAELEPGRVIRIEYLRSGAVRVYYKTGADDANGRRDPYQLRESERWAAIYQKLAPSLDNPIKWGPGEPADLEPFPSARDPRQRGSAKDQSFDYLIPGRAIVLIFQPTRYQSDLRAELEFREILRSLRDHYRPQIEQLARTLSDLQVRSSLPSATAASPGVPAGAAPVQSSPG